MLDLLTFFESLNNTLALPATIVFVCVGVLLTIKTKFLQFRAIPRFFSLLKKDENTVQRGKKISAFHALFAAMATTLGMGNIIGPSIAIVAGGPGALFWLVVYAFFGSVTKFTEVAFAIQTRKQTKEGKIIGGPTQYLTLIHPFLSHWYGGVMVILLALFAGLQANTLAGILAKESVIPWHTGLVLAGIVFFVLRGGAQRVGYIASKLVPVMCFFYVSFALLILCKDLTALSNAVRLVFSHILTPVAPVGGFLGATVFQAMRAGVYKSIFITEAGLGTASIPHSVANTQSPTDQGILALVSTAVEAALAVLSGLLVLVTGVWASSSHIDNTLMYQVFKMNSPSLGRFVLIGSIALFVLTTVIGNSFNGTQSFASMTRHRWVWMYRAFVIAVVFIGSFMRVPLIWAMVDVLLTLVAVPHLISLLILAYTKPHVVKV